MIISVDFWIKVSRNRLKSHSDRLLMPFGAGDSFCIDVVLIIVIACHDFCVEKVVLSNLDLSGVGTNPVFLTSICESLCKEIVRSSTVILSTDLLCI